MARGNAIGLRGLRGLLELIRQTIVSSLLNPPRVVGVSQVLFLLQLKMDQIARIKVDRVKIGVTATIKKGQITVIFAPDDRFLIVLIAPKYYTNHRIYCPSALTSWLLTNMSEKPRRRTTAFCVSNWAA